MATWTRRLTGLLRAPLDDYLRALHALLPGMGVGEAAVALAALAVSWWIYVPLHELAHALGCIAAGGEVTRLEIDPLYGAAILARFFPFVAVGSRYAGQLTGFDTRGSDLTYLLTDFLPFLLTVLLGVPALRWVGVRAGGGKGGAALLGAALPIAYAPFISLAGDYYEMGSILVSRLVGAWTPPDLPIERWRSDDFFALAAELAPGASWLDAGVLGASLLVGAALAWLTYGAGGLVARLLGIRPSSGGGGTVLR